MLALLLLATTAAADDGTAAVTTLRRPVAGHAVFELRAGADSRAGGPGEGPSRPYLCGEVTPLKRVGVEACGNGAGVLQQRDLSDMAHFRLRVTAGEVQTEQWDWALIAGAGFAEIQRGADAAGFRFGTAEPGQVEAAGAEASVSVKGRFWPLERGYGTVDLNMGAAVIPGAPEVMQDAATGPVVPFGSITAGFGF